MFGCQILTFLFSLILVSISYAEETFVGESSHCSDEGQTESTDNNNESDVCHRNLKLGSLMFLPSIGISAGKTDNVSLAPNSEKVSSRFIRVSPALRAEVASDKSVVALTYNAEFVEYKESPTSDVDNHRLRAEYTYDPTTRTLISLFAEYEEGNDDRGTGGRQGGNILPGIDPDEYERTGFGAHWSYGGVGSRGKIELEASKHDLDYTNNRIRTSLLDREDSRVRGTFFFRMAPKTALLIEKQYADIDYDIADFDSTEDTTYVGVKWDVSARTSGTIKYGWQEKDFDSPARSDYDGSVVVAAVDWRPRTYSNFNITATRETEETDGFGDFILRSDISVSWVHDWSTRFNTSLDYGVGEDEHRPGVRLDDVTFWGLSAQYSLNRYLQVGAGVGEFERESNLSEFNATSKTYLFTLEASY